MTAWFRLRDNHGSQRYLVFVALGRVVAVGNGSAQSSACSCGDDWESWLAVRRAWGWSAEKLEETK